MLCDVGVGVGVGIEGDWYASLGRWLRLKRHMLQWPVYAMCRPATELCPSLEQPPMVVELFCCCYVLVVAAVHEEGLMMGAV